MAAFSRHRQRGAAADAFSPDLWIEGVAPGHRLGQRGERPDFGPGQRRQEEVRRGSPADPRIAQAPEPQGLHGDDRPRWAAQTEIVRLEMPRTSKVIMLLAVKGQPADIACRPTSEVFGGGAGHRLGFPSEARHDTHVYRGGRYRAAHPTPLYEADRDPCTTTRSGRDGATCGRWSLATWSVTFEGEKETWETRIFISDLGAERQAHWGSQFADKSWGIENGVHALGTSMWASTRTLLASRTAMARRTSARCPLLRRQPAPPRGRSKRWRQGKRMACAARCQLSPQGVGHTAEVDAVSPAARATSRDRDSTQG